MRLMTKKLEKHFAEVGSQEKEKDPVIVAKFFNPFGAGTWYAVQYDPVSELFFGYVSLFGDWRDEWTYFSLARLESYVSTFGTGIERDLSWRERKASEIPVIR